MLNWILLALAAGLAALFLCRRLHAQRRHQRRGVRRARRKAYARLWDQVMVRPRIKRIAMVSRTDAADSEPRRNARRR